MAKDSFKWLRRHVWVPAARMAAAFALVASDSIATLYEAGTTRLVGFEFDAAGQFCFDSLMLPFDMDPDFSIKFRLHYTGKSTTAADTYTWKGFYNNALSAAAVVDPATAMSPDFGATNVLSGTAYRVGRSAWAGIAGKTWTRAEIEAGHLVSLEFELDASDATLASEQVYLAGYEFSYVPQYTAGEGSKGDYDAA